MGYLTSPLLACFAGLKAKTVLDIGCGNGWFTNQIASQGIEITGIDASESGIENCRKLMPKGRFSVASVYEPDILEGEQFDAVVSIEVIEHLFYPGKLVELARAKLKPGGRFILTTPYHGYLKNLSISLSGKWDPHFQPAKDGGHIKFFSLPTLRKLVEKEGFAMRNFRGCGRLPFLWKTMILEFDG